MLALVVATPACSGDPSQPSRRVEAEATGLFETLALMEISGSPETLTRLGLPRNLLDVDTNALIGDRSQAAFERQRLRRIEALRLLEEMPLARLGSRLRGHQEMVLRTYDRAVRVGEFGHGRVLLGNAYPYIVDHRSGAWVDLVDLLVTRQRVSDADDAGDYLLRLAQLASAMEDERLRLLADARAGVQPPRFVLEKLMERLQADLAVPIDEDPIILAYEDQLTGLIGEAPETRRAFRKEAVDLMRERVRPAYGNLIETIDEIKDDATDVPGVWTLPEGDSYYDAMLAVHTRGTVSAESLHREARARVDELSAELVARLGELDAETPAVEMAAAAEGAEPQDKVGDDNSRPSALGERLAALGMREDQAYPNTPEGRDELAGNLRASLDRAKVAMENWIARQPDMDVTVRITSPRKRLPAAALYAPPTPDGADPGILFVDGRNLSRWPRYAIPALVLHETVPGHHTEATFAMETAELPLIRQLMWHTGYGEGWATYAERLGLEAGVFADDPLAEIGILQSQLFSAARQVVDTGIHRMRWERQEAIDYLVKTTGLPEEAMIEEVDRIVVWPGQACAYTAGANEISAIRARARAVVGPAFDPAAFHYTLLAGGPRPLEQVEADMERWYEAQMAVR